MVEESAPVGAVNKNVHRLNSLASGVENDMLRSYDSDIGEPNLNINEKVSQSVFLYLFAF